ncbi:hypothetical protein F8388_005346 [Cannabis sativa]|uniref:Receptor-like serine/threonine-protein kinase n=1 Tax=Cannabis sativa TaxID=3483 RepID=A0A7J6ELB3_CANSA|nr:hypothetical protein F8388_005346 [Cannabis sativa]KAF4374939.1 hypothetical protein G4B88_004690 [Cannabis sativa]
MADNLLSSILCLLLVFLINYNAQAQRQFQGSFLIAQTNGVISSWKSPSGEFAFGFQQIQNNGFLLAIWFEKIPQKTIVWSANGNSLVPQGSRVELTRSSGSLVLKDPSGGHIWSSDEVGASAASYAAMLDNGNFVLANSDYDDHYLWESFDHPTDTLLPQQTLVQGTKLVARYSELNYSNGRFHLILKNDGNLVLYCTTIFSVEYNNFVYWETNTEGNDSRLVFNDTGFVYLEDKNNGTLLVELSNKGTSTQDFYQRVILEHDGVLRVYVYPKREDSSSMGWSFQNWTHLSPSYPENICTSIKAPTGSGACGFNSYCSLGDQDRKPTCQCPRSYMFIDAEDPIQGCKQSFQAQSCDLDSSDADMFTFYNLENGDFHYSDYEHLFPMSEDQCRKSCLSDFFCAAIYYDGNSCFKKQSPLVNGMINSELNGKALIKIRKDNNTSSTAEFVDTNLMMNKNEKSRLVVIIGSVLFSGSVLLNIILLIFVAVSRKWKPKAVTIEPNQGMQGLNLHTFTYEELDKATNGFKEQLGRGAFGNVFIGTLEMEDRNLVAVKKLDSNMVKESDEKEFNAEVNAIGHTNHKYLVQLIGFCNEGQHRLLVYEYMRNGSLASFLFGLQSRPNWLHRKKLALEISRGILYLHAECTTQIIHCDIKPENILLDEFFVARISDFGLAKILKTDQTQTTTGIRGSKGYVAPEWFKNMAVTAKVDVYSYGILLLELICCRKNYEAEIEDEDDMILADLAYDCYACIGGKRLEFLVKNDEEAKEDMEIIKKTAFQKATNIEGKTTAAIVESLNNLFCC